MKEDKLALSKAVESVDTDLSELTFSACGLQCENYYLFSISRPIAVTEAYDTREFLPPY